MTKSRPHNIVLAIGGLNGFVSKEVQNSTFVLKIPPIANTRTAVSLRYKNSGLF